MPRNYLHTNWYTYMNNKTGYCLEAYCSPIYISATLKHFHMSVTTELCILTTQPQLACYTNFLCCTVMSSKMFLHFGKEMKIKCSQVEATRWVIQDGKITNTDPLQLFLHLCASQNCHMETRGCGKALSQLYFQFSHCFTYHSESVVLPVA
jgi:hypothetical protein